MRRPAPALPPGFMVVHGNHPEALRDLMVAWLQRHPLAPLEDELVLVQSNGVAQWLKLSLAASPAHGGLGVAAALRTALPSAALWEVYRALLGAEAVPPASALDETRVTWRLMRLLPECLQDPAFAPLQRFLDDDADCRKRHQLAARLADLLDQYQVYRADWLEAWAAGRDVIADSRGSEQPVPGPMLWQPRLWRALLADVGEPAAASGRAQVHRRFLAAANGWSGPAPAALPRRVTVFGISSLPRQSLEVLAALARFSQVLLCVHNPCEHDWSEITSRQELARRHLRRPGLRGEPGGDALHVETQPLLAAWGKQGRDFIRLLEEHDRPQEYAHHFLAIGQRIDLFQPNPQDTLLRQLQDDIRDLRPLPETRSTWPPVDPAQDRSIAFHIAHGPQREVEVLHDQLLAAFTRNPALRPRDVIVMVPDIAAYAAHIQAVFGLVGRDDPRHIPFSVADQGQRQQEPLLGALEKLLHLPTLRLGVSDVLDLLEVAALRARYGIGEEQLPLLHRWVEAARIRWGLHAAQRAALDLPPGIEQNSWHFGLRRMLLGYAVGQGQAWNGIEPLDEIGGLDAVLIGPLVRLLDALEAHWRALAQPLPPAAWAERMRGLLQAFFLAEDGSPDGLALLRAQDALDDWQQACAEAALDAPLPLSVVRDHWLAALEPPALRQPFFAGGVTFASLMPMRAIPFRWVALLGMNDGDYPRLRPPLDFDLMARDPRPGDRARREDDRYLFLEALLSAREHLHVSWVGRSIRDNEPRPPSVLVAQLRDHIAAGWRRAAARGQPGVEPAAAGEAGDGGLLQALTIEHRLQPFHPAYFDGSQPGLFSFAREWRASLASSAALSPAGGMAAPAAPPQADGLPELPGHGTLTLRQLGDFLKSPARAFLQQRLDIHFDRADEREEDQEPFRLDGLENWKLQDELLRVQRAAVDAGQPREPALRLQLERIAARGELPHGAFAQQVQEALAQPMERVFDKYRRALADWPQVLPDQPLEEEGAGGQRLEDWLTGLRADGDGRRARLVLESSALLAKVNERSKARKWRFDRLLPHWVAHLAGQLHGGPLTTIVLSKAGAATLRPLPPPEVQQWWTLLLAARQRGMRSPLPFDVQVAAAWLHCELPFKGAPDLARADDAARKAYGVQCERDACLARAFPTFEQLWADGALRHCAHELLLPLRVQAGPPPDDGEEEP